MDTSLCIKVIVFIILGLFASWPYFEKYNDYSWLKRIWIGTCILLLLILGTMDIKESDTQTKEDKKEITKSNNKIISLTSEVSKLELLINAMRETQSDQLDEMDKKQDDRFNALNDRLTIKLQENKGNIEITVKDTTH